MKYILFILLLISINLNGQTLSKNIGFGHFGSGRTMFESAGGEINYNDSADALFERMDEQPDDARKLLISTVFDTLQEYNIDDSLKMFYIPKAHTAQAAALDWIRDTSFVMNDSMYFLTDVGFIRNAYKGHIDTRFNPRNYLTTNNAYYGVYLQDAKYFTTTSIIIGASDGTNIVYSGIGINKTWNNHIINGTANVAYSVPNPKFQGLYTLGRYRSDSIILIEGTATTRRVSTSSNTPNKNLYLNAHNNNGTTAYYCNNAVGMAYAASKLTELQLTKLNNITQYYTTQVDDSKTETIWENDDAYVKLLNVDGIGYGLTLVYQKDDKKIIANNDTLYLSLDAGATYPYKGYCVDDELISCAFMYTNNTILIGTLNKKLYVSYDSLSTISTLTLKDGHGNYTFHTPGSATYPGNYFLNFDVPKTYVQNGREMVVWGNYANVWYGASPVNIYYSADTAKTVKIAYKFGVDSSYRDNSADAPSSSAGNYLGEASNPIKSRHVHSVTYSSLDTAWYCATGDSWPNTAGQYEIVWLKGKYNAVTDTFIWSEIVNYGDTTYFKSIGLETIGDTIYWAGDGPAVGIYKSKVTEITDRNKFKKSYDSYAYYSFNIQGNNMIATRSEGNKFLYSGDLGQTWSYFDLDGIVTRTGNTLYTFNVGYKDSNEWYYFQNTAYPIIKSKGNTILFKMK